MRGPCCWCRFRAPARLPLCLPHYISKPTCCTPAQCSARIKWCTEVTKLCAARSECLLAAEPLAHWLMRRLAQPGAALAAAMLLPVVQLCARVRRRCGACLSASSSAGLAGPR